MPLDDFIQSAQRDPKRRRGEFPVPSVSTQRLADDAAHELVLEFTKRGHQVITLKAAILEKISTLISSLVTDESSMIQRFSLPSFSSFHRSR